MSQTLLFDVDGTLTDTFDKAAKIIDDLATTFKYPVVQDRKKLRRIDWRDLPAFLGVSRLRRGRFTKVFRDRLRQAMMTESLSDDINKVLNIITTSGYRVGAMTSSSLSNFERIAHESQYFTMTDLGDYDVNKERVLRDFLSRFNLAPNEVVYVGDEIEDVQAAKAIGLTSVGAAWGLNHEIALQEQHPDFVVYKPEELLTVISGLGE